jgi:hypothetical protein
MQATTNVMGLFGATSNFPCFICEVHKENLANMSVCYLRRTEKIQNEIMNSWKRVNGELVHPTRQYKNKYVHWGYSQPSLLDGFISYDNLVIEILHMWLRITRKLFGLLARDIIEASDVDKITDLKNTHVHFKTYIDYLQITCGFKSLEPTPKVENRIERLHRDLNGYDTETFVDKLMFLRPLFDSFEDGRLKYKIWTNFYNIYMKIRNEGYSSPEALRKDTSKWFKLYTDVYSVVDDVTPYIHIFASHLHEQMGKFGNVSHFCTQGLCK